MEGTLFKRIGGMPVVEAAVNKFYDGFLADSEIYHFFEDIDVVLQKRKLRRFFEIILDEKSDISKADITLYHQKLRDKKLLTRHIKLWHNLMRKTLLELNIPIELVAEVEEKSQKYEEYLEELCVDQR